MHGPQCHQLLNGVNAAYDTARVSAEGTSRLYRLRLRVPGPAGSESPHASPRLASSLIFSESAAGRPPAGLASKLPLIFTLNIIHVAIGDFVCWRPVDELLIFLQKCSSVLDLYTYDHGRKAKVNQLAAGYS